MDLFYRSERSDRDGAWMRSNDSLTLFVVRRIAAMPLIANPLYSFHERRVGWGKETGYCPMFDCRWSIHPEIIRTKGYGFVWVSGAGNAMKFNEKMQET